MLRTLLEVVQACHQISQKADSSADPELTCKEIATFEPVLAQATVELDKLISQGPFLDDDAEVQVILFTWHDDQLKCI